MSNATVATSPDAYSLSMDSSLLWTYLGSLGVPTLLLLGGAMVIMHIYEWKTTKFAAALVDTALEGDSPSTRASALLWICRLLLVVLPLGLAITWGYVSAENLNGLFGEWPNMICKMA